MKISLLVAILLATTLFVAVVGIRQLERLRTMDSQLMLASDCRVNLLRALRAEKNAIIMSDKARAEEYKKMAEKALADARESNRQLAALSGSSTTDEGRAAADLERAFDEFAKNQKEV